MFLNRLTLKEKQAFLTLAHHVANIDEDFSKEERVIIDKYCMEMQIDDVEYDPDNFDLDDVLEVFEDDGHKKIALLELMALVFSDGQLHSAEEITINEIVERFGLNPNLAIVYKEWAKSILSLFIQGEALIHL
ncbi:TerB family tellurite resistance protein [Marinobacter sp. ANT_B65]|uniref:TerB family tellurite resistance protein n=1 Tax=Marinobacter sp. ANT_B65 TaxID=2039467 RepID=UPI000BBE47DB|nr:TerB family tellurite resistance protein [Marinobacter sp. ANT_B65]PCM45944.1 hypothetical protein CPA50_08290 [Marinobacter sp. ANT_B65]